MTSTVLMTDPQPDPAPRPADQTEEPARPPGWLAAARRFAAGRWLPRLVELLAVIPVVTMLVEVSRAGRLQYIDYWYVLWRITETDGSLKPFSLQNYLSNEHLLGLPSLVYWINIQLFDGDNRTLGVYVVAVAAATVLALRAALPRTLPPLLRASIVVAAAALIFSLHGLWNYTRAMSGTAWLTANLIVVVSLLLASRGRWWPAWACAVLASVTYGTAFAVWPVLAVFAVVKREVWWRRLVPLAVGGVIVAVWLVYRPSAPLPGAPTSDIASLVYNFLAVVGQLWTANNGGMAVVAGAVVLGIYAALVTSRTARQPGLWFWWALAAHAFVGSAMIAAARVDYGAEAGLTPRYTSASVLMSIPALVLLAVVLHQGGPRRMYKIASATLLAGLVGYTLGSPVAVEERVRNQEHQLEAVALRGGFSDAYRRLPPAEELVPRLRAMGHYPFTDDFTLGCGGPELGSTLDLDAMSRMPGARGNRVPDHPAGAVERTDPVDPAPVFDGKPVPIIFGWAADATDPVRCTVIVDGSGEVVGGGQSRIQRPDIAFQYAGMIPDSGFAVIGPVDDDSRVVVLHESGTMRWMPTDPNAEPPVPPAAPR